MRFVRNGSSVEDPYQRIADDALIPEAGAVLLTASRLMAEAVALSSRAAPIGVIWPNNRDVEELAPHLSRVDCVALVFPSFRDGRAYSQARLLRERYQYRGELRATGQVLRDQFLFMLRAGFTAFEVAKDRDADHFAEAAQRYTRFYQPSVDRRPVISKARQPISQQRIISA